MVIDLNTNQGEEEDDDDEEEEDINSYTQRKENFKINIKYQRL